MFLIFFSETFNIGVQCSSSPFSSRSTLFPKVTLSLTLFPVHLDHEETWGPSPAVTPQRLTRQHSSHTPETLQTHQAPLVSPPLQRPRHLPCLSTSHTLRGLSHSTPRALSLCPRSIPSAAHQASVSALTVPPGVSGPSPTLPLAPPRHHPS